MNVLALVLEVLCLLAAAYGVFLLAGLGAALLFAGAAGVFACEWASARRVRA